MSGIGSLPPQICALALGVNGLSGVYAQWARIQGLHLAPVPSIFALIAMGLMSAYVMKAILAPASVMQDLSTGPGLAAVNAGPAVVQVLAVRFGYLLPTVVTQGFIMLCYALHLMIAIRFVYVNLKQGHLPDPSWFPGILLLAMCNITSHAAGPAFLQEVLHIKFGLLLLVYAPLMIVVAYRILLSPVRDSVAPNASMATLMAPSSLFTFVHLATGKPFGDNVGVALFCASTIFYMITIWMLYSRRSLWMKAFHPSYVSFGFPFVSSAMAALLASEKLPLLAGTALRSWAALLTLVATSAVCIVLPRFLWMVRSSLLPAFGNTNGSSKKAN